MRPFFLQLLTTFKDKHGLRAWKSHSWDVLDRLHENGYIRSDKGKVRDADRRRRGAVKGLFEKHFMTE